MANLSYGQISLSLGNVLIFVFTIWLSVQMIAIRPVSFSKKMFTNASRCRPEFPTPFPRC